MPIAHLEATNSESMEQNKTVLTGEQIDAIEALFEYMEPEERDSYGDHLASGSAEPHIYDSLIVIGDMLGKTTYNGQTRGE